jgi:hypothetical protein
MLRATVAFPSGKHGEDWAFRRYLDMGPLWAAEEKPTKIATWPEACLVDACQVRGVGAQVLAALRAFLVSLLHRQGVREKKAALEAFSFNPLAALRFLGLYAV